MERDPKKTWHDCMGVKGNGVDCTDCPVMVQGHCESLTSVLSKMASNLDSRYKDLSKEDREQILSETVDKVVENLEKQGFRGESKFSTWAWSIYRNKRFDCIRRSNAQKDRFVNLSRILKENEDEEIVFKRRLDEEGTAKEMRERELEAHAIILTLKKNLTHDPTGCVKLYLDLYYAWEENKQDKDLAAEYGVKQNALTKRKMRCRDVIQNLIEVENG